MNLRRKLMFAAVFTAMCASVTGLALAQPHGSGTPGRLVVPADATTSHETVTEHGDEVGGPHEDHDTSINWTDVFDKKKPAIIALFINFGVLAGLYYMLGKKPVAAALKQRRATIAKDIEDARKRLKESEARAEKYQAELKSADNDAATAMSTLVTSAKGDIERLRKDAGERAERMERDATRLVDQEKKQLQDDILRQTVERSMAEAERVLAQITSGDDHTRLARDLLAELAKIPAAKATARGVQ